MEVTLVPNEHIVAQRVCVGQGLGGLPVLLPWIPSLLPWSPLFFPGSPHSFPGSLEPHSPSLLPQSLVFLPWSPLFLSWSPSLLPQTPGSPHPSPSLSPRPSLSLSVSPRPSLSLSVPFLVPHGLDDVVGGKRKRRGPMKPQDFTRWFSAAYNNVTEGRKTRRKGPTFADLEVLYWRHFKERLAAHRKLQRRGVSGVRAKLGAQAHRPAVPVVAALQDDLGPAAHAGHPAEEPVGIDHLESLHGPEHLVDAGPQLPVGLVLDVGEGHLEGRGLCQVAFPDTPCPLAVPQESRVPFDVRAYGLALTGRCAELGRWHSLASLVAGQPPFEVCRYLLASLQLANDAEVELVQEPGLEAALDTARLRLLSARPAHERFQHFQLPS
uniref:Condensin-2 complex subunit H2 n=1 Tax=Junco hyemalis TaxID=40217 RepID=A0A8C5JRQ0_JUNHY